MASTTEFRHCLWITLYMNKVILFFFAFLFGATGSAYAQRFQLDIKAGTAASADIYESLGNLNDPKISSGKLKQHNYDIQAELKLFSIFWVGAGMRGIRFNSNSIDQLSLREIESNGSLDHFEGKFILKPISKDNTDLGLYAGIGFADSDLNLESISLNTIENNLYGNYLSNFFTARVGAKGFHYFRPLSNFGIGGEVYVAPLVEFGRTQNGNPAWLQGDGFNGRLMGYNLDLRYLLRVNILKRPLSMYVGAGVDHQDLVLNNKNGLLSDQFVKVTSFHFKTGMRF